MIYKNNMGIAFLPGTFPTSTVQAYLKEWFHSIDWTREKVNNLYAAYKDSVTIDSKKYYGPGQVEVKYHIIDKYGFPLTEVTPFLVALYKLSAAGNINPYYLNFVETKSALLPSIISKAGSGLDKYVKNLKFFSVIAVIGFGIYLTWPLLAKGRKKLQKRI